MPFGKCLNLIFFISTQVSKEEVEVDEQDVERDGEASGSYDSGSSKSQVPFVGKEQETTQSEYFPNKTASGGGDAYPQTQSNSSLA